MDLTLSADQEALREAFGDLFAKESTPARVRAAEPSGFDADLWGVLVAAGLPVMDGATLGDLVIVAREAGRRLASAPVVEAVAAARLLGRFPVGKGLLPQIAAGSILPALALHPPRDGVARLVPAGAVADVVVILDGDDLLAVRQEPPGGAPPNLGCQPIADVRLDSPLLLASGEEAHRAHAAAVTEWTLLTAAALDGLREEALRIAVDYVKQRHAFGVPIGWFQSVGHRLADVATAGEGAELLVHEAAWVLGNNKPRGRELTLMAFLHAAETAFATARAGLQFHGGYGYTLEYDIQLYLRRAKAWPLALGAPRHLYRALAREAL